MKTILSIITITAVMASCTSHPNVGLDSSKVSTISDTAGLAEFQAWQAYNAVKTNTETAAIIKTPISGNTASRKTSRPVAQQESKPVSGGGSMSSESENAAKPIEKKGWSKAAKGAAIGAGSGAVLGAVIHKKNRVAGGVIGGVVGGGVGYGIGRGMDKRDGRY